MNLKNQAKKSTKSSAPHGGSRKGAGRKPGGKNAEIRARKALQQQILTKAMETGMTPLQVMMATMHEYYTAAQASCEHTDERLTLLKTASEIAKDAAPYCHSRLASMEHKGSDGGPINHRLVVEFVE